MQAPCGGLPEAVRGEEVVGEGTELAHDGGGANLGCLPQSRRRWQKAAGLVVGEVAGESAGFEIRVEPALPDVNAGDEGGHAAGTAGWAAVAPLATPSEFVSCVSWA